MRQRIIVADDDPSIRRLLADLLEAEGYPVCVAENGAEALDLVEQEAPALLILDLDMPQIDGHEVVRSLGERALKQFPILVFSGGSGRDEIEASVDSVVTKGIDLDLLLAKVAHLLDVGPQAAADARVVASAD